MTYDDYIINSKELYHHGVLGMKWGVRRYQNKDGSLTPEGWKRYRDNSERAVLTTKEAKRARTSLTSEGFDSYKKDPGVVLSAMPETRIALKNLRPHFKKVKESLEKSRKIYRTERNKFSRNSNLVEQCKDDFLIKNMGLSRNDPEYSEFKSPMDINSTFSHYLNTIPEDKRAANKSLSSLKKFRDDLEFARKEAVIQAKTTLGNEVADLTVSEAFPNIKIEYFPDEPMSELYAVILSSKLERELGIP